jgi:hypothetical protein
MDIHGTAEERPENSTTRAVDSQNKGRTYYRVAALFFFIFPVMMVSFPGIPIWLGRAAAVSIFFFFMTVAIFWFGLSPKSKMIQGGPLTEPRFEKTRRKIDLGIRSAVIAFGLIFLFYKTLPLASDLFHLSIGEKPAKFTARVAYETSSLGGVFFGERSVRFARDGMSYTVFYSWTSPLRVGTSYEFIVLPRSRLILDFHENLVRGADLPLNHPDAPHDTL